MKTDDVGQVVYDQSEIIDTIMSGDEPPGPFLTADTDIDVEQVNKSAGRNFVEQYTPFDGLLEDFDRQNQNNWIMPSPFKDMDVCKHVLDCCNGEVELQRCGEELLLYQKYGLFDLLRYMVYLVDTMEKHNIIWGVGRGSSVSSYVLYKLKVHKIDSIYYGLDIKEFLRD